MPQVKVSLWLLSLYLKWQSVWQDSLSGQDKPHILHLVNMQCWWHDLNILRMWDNADCREFMGCRKPFEDRKPMDFPCDSSDKQSACNAGDLCSIPGLGRSSGEGKGYLLQYSGLENSMENFMGSQRVRRVWATFTFTRKPIYWFCNSKPSLNW